MAASPVRVTLQDIAKKFGCSRATVSLALSNHPRIRERVRKEIRELAEKMGYRPDPTLAMLARNRFAGQAGGYRATLAYLVDTKEESHEPLDIQMRYLPSASRRAEELGYQLRQFDLADYASGELASNVLYHRGVQGIVIPEMARFVEPMLRGSGWERFAIVCCMVGWAVTPYHTVRKDIFNNLRLMWREAVARGYQRIGGALFQHHPIAEEDYARYGGSVAEQRQLIPERRRLPMFLGHPTDVTGFIEWVRQYRPDAIVSFIEAPYFWLRNAGYRIPQDIAFACATVEPGMKRYSGVAALRAELGGTAIDFLVSLIHQNQRGIPDIQQTLSLEPKWVEGATLPRLALHGSERRGRARRRPASAE